MVDHIAETWAYYQGHPAGGSPHPGMAGSNGDLHAMGRSSRTGQWHANNVVMEAVNALDWRVELSDREVVIASNGVVKLRARLDADVLEFGIERDFDRWANSTDIVFGIKDYEPAKIEEAMRRRRGWPGRGCAVNLATAPSTCATTSPGSARPFRPPPEPSIRTCRMPSAGGWFQP